MIELESLNKIFTAEGAPVHAVDHVSLSVEEGDVFGIVGYSGAGKSTLVRCINLLERPDAGTLRVAGFGKVRCDGKKAWFLPESGGAETASSAALAVRPV